MRGPRPRFKDWELGEVRVTAAVVTPQGGQLKLYMPHLTKNQGEAVIVLLSRICSDLPAKLEWVDPKTGEVKEINI